MGEQRHLWTDLQHWIHGHGAMVSSWNCHRIVQIKLIVLFWASIYNCASYKIFVRESGNFPLDTWKHLQERSVCYPCNETSKTHHSPEGDNTPEHPEIVIGISDINIYDTQFLNLCLESNYKPSRLANNSIEALGRSKEECICTDLLSAHNWPLVPLSNELIRDGLQEIGKKCRNSFP